MAFKKVFQREMEVAFSKKAQAPWVRVLKYIILTALVYFFYEYQAFWFILLGVGILALSVHFFYRYKTKGWTQSYGGWKSEDFMPKKKNE